MADIVLKITADTSNAVENIRKVQTESQKMSDSVEQGTKRRIGLIEQEERRIAGLSERRNKSVDIENLKIYNKLLEDSKNRLNDLQQAGLKTQKTNESFMASVSKWALSLGGVAVMFQAVKKAIAETETGLRLLNTTQAIYKQFMYDLVNGYGFQITKLIAVIKYQKELNDLREKDRSEQIQAAIVSKKYDELLFQAADHTKTSTERLRLLTEALAENNKLIDIKVKNGYEELDVLRRLILLRPQDTELLEKYKNTVIGIINTEAERVSSTRRVESQRTAIIQEEEEKRKTFNTKIEKAMSDFIEATQRDIDNSLKQTMDNLKKFYSDLKELDFEKIDKIKWDPWQGVMDQVATAKTLSRNLLDVKLQTIEKSKEADQAYADFELEMMKEVNQEKIKESSEAANRIFDAGAKALDVFSNFLLAKKQRDLKAAGDNLSLQEKINKEYFKKEQTLAIARAIINTALAVTEALASSPPPFNAILAAISSAAGAAEIAVIKSQKYAKGGWTGKGGQRDETGERMAGIVHEEEFVVKRGPAARYREMLDAINKDDHKALISSFNKIDIAGGVSPVVNNAVLVQNDGPNMRLDRLINEQKKLNNQFANHESIINVGNNKIIKKGKSIRIIHK